MPRQHPWNRIPRDRNIMEPPMESHVNPMEAEWKSYQIPWNPMDMHSFHWLRTCNHFCAGTAEERGAASAQEGELPTNAHPLAHGSCAQRLRLTTCSKHQQSGSFHFLPWFITLASCSMTLEKLGFKPRQSALQFDRRTITMCSRISNIFIQVH